MSLQSWRNIRLVKKPPGRRLGVVLGLLGCSWWGGEVLGLLVGVMLGLLGGSWMRFLSRRSNMEFLSSTQRNGAVASVLGP